MLNITILMINHMIIQFIFHSYMIHMMSCLGGIIFGLLSDWLERRSPVLFFMMLAAPFAIWGYQGGLAIS